jgi:ABC-type transport system involved in cytochrome c biogenesis ATPase subunit
MLDRQLYLLDEVETGLDVTSRDILKTMILEEMKL